MSISDNALVEAAVLADRQGLTLVHFSYHPEPFLPLNLVTTQHIPQKVLTLSRKVDEGKTLPTATSPTASCPTRPSTWW